MTVGALCRSRSRLSAYLGISQAAETGRRQVRWAMTNFQRSGEWPDGVESLAATQAAMPRPPILSTPTRSE